MTIGQNIRKIRKEKGLTQKKLSQLSGIAEITIRQYERGLYKPKIEAVEKIAKALDVPIVRIKENLTLAEHMKTEEYREMQKESLLFEGIIVAIEKIYGDIEEKYVMSENGWQRSYWLVGKSPDTFVLYEHNIEAIVKFTKASIPDLVNHAKDSRPESEIIQGILQELNKLPSAFLPKTPSADAPPPSQEGKDTTAAEPPEKQAENGE